MDAQQIIDRADRMEYSRQFSLAEDPYHPDDAPHRVFRDVGLMENAELHRITNHDSDGDEVECSAIWKDGFEYAWHYAHKEKDMIEWWQDRGYLLVQMDLLTADER